MSDLMTETIRALDPEQLMAHVRNICEQIGPRPAITRNERRAAEFVRQELWAAGVEDVREQKFSSIDSSGWGVLPYAVTAALVQPLGFFGWFGKLLSSAALLGAAFSFRETLLAKRPFYQRVFEMGESQNVHARIAPTGQTRRILYLVAHLDTNKQRLSKPGFAPATTKWVNTAGLLITIASALSLLGAAFGRQKSKGAIAVQGAASTVSLVTLISLVIDEMFPYVDGANDNASGIAVLLGIAAALKEQPLQHTEVNLLFTGSQEALSGGMHSYLEQFAPPQDNSYWINVEMVGAGRVCYVTQHGESFLSEYRPGPRITALAAEVARQKPELAVTGRPLPLVDEVAPLVQRGYEAICISGYGENGTPPNWHRRSDTVANIESETLGRAGAYVWSLVQAVDQEAGR